MLDPGTPSPIAAHYRDFITGREEKSAQVALIRNRVLPKLRESRIPHPSCQRVQLTAVSPDLQFSARPIGTGPFSGKRGLRGDL